MEYINFRECHCIVFPKGGGRKEVRILKHPRKRLSAYINEYAKANGFELDSWMHEVSLGSKIVKLPA